MNEEYREGTITGKLILLISLAIAVGHFSGLATIPYIKPVAENIFEILIFTTAFMLVFFGRVTYVLIAIYKEKVWPPSSVPVAFKTEVKPVER